MAVMVLFRAVYILTIFSGFIQESVQVPPFTIPLSVRPGTNRLSCIPLENARELQKNVSSISWSKRPPGGSFEWIAGSNMAHVDMEKGSRDRYTLDPVTGTFEIRNVTCKDNHDEYKCSILGSDVRESSIYKLVYFQPEEDQTCTSNTSVCNCSEASFTPPGNETTDQTSTNNTSVCNCSEASFTPPGNETTDRTCACNCSSASFTPPGNDTTDNLGADGNCMIWKIFVSLLSVTILVPIGLKLYPYLYTHIVLKIRGLFTSQDDESVDANRENAAFDGTCSDADDCNNQEKVDKPNDANAEKDYVHLSVRENSAENDILPWNSLEL